MLKVPAKYREMAERDAREVSVKVVMGETELTNDDITELSIYRSLGENGFNIGGVVTARVRMVALMKLPYSGEISMDVFVRFGFDSESCSEYVQLGHFYGHASNPSNKTAQVEIIGYDKLGSSAFNSRCTFAKVGDAELAFPCTVQEMLEYVCKRRGLETEFECLDYTVSEMPVKDKSRDNSDYERYYTYKEIIGFIAAAHGATAAIDSGGSLVFIGAKESSETINSGDCVDFSLTASEAFTVKGILLHVQNTLSTGSTNIFINDDSETAYDGEISEGVIETSCPFGSIEIAEGLWEQLGGFSYSSCEFARRGRGWTELGDIVSAVDNLREKVNGEYIKGKAVVQTVELSFSTDGGFTERVISKAENAEESAERLGTGNSINKESGGVGKFTNTAKNSEKFNDYKNNYINPNTAYAHVSGGSNSIDKDSSGSTYAAIVGGMSNSLKNAAMSAIVGGQSNSILNSLFSAILGGTNNKITVRGLAKCFIAGGENNEITENGSNSVIFGGSGNKVTNSFSAILGGMDNTVSGYFSAVVGGMNNTVTGRYSTVLDGYSNTVKSDNSAVIAGSDNTVECFSCVVCGGGNKILNSGGNAGYNVFVCGEHNEVTNAQNCIICGKYAKATNEHFFVVGGGSDKGNVYWVDVYGNVYAKSFNIIGESTASEASAFSARSTENADISELAEQINQMKSEIEALKAEIDELKAR